MSTVQTLRINSDHSEASEKIGQQLGRKLVGGEVIELISDLGGGKTTFVRGVVHGAGSNDHVSSPTFTISNIYKTKNVTINHFDFYRLSEPGLIEYDLEDVLADAKNVVIVEWSDVIKHVLPEERLTIHIKSSGENEREFTFTYPESLHYLVGEL